MMDYGAIAWKDGKLISTDMFTDMKDMVGWDDSDIETESPLVDNYFAYVGDKDFTLAFYKSIMRIYNPTFTYDNEEIFFGSEHFEKWKRWEFNAYVNRDFVSITVKPKRFHDYYLCHMEYKGHKYKVAFGYGVDIDYYKKTHIIDYFGTPWYRAGSMWFNFKHIYLYDFVYDIKLRLRRGQK